MHACQPRTWAVEAGGQGTQDLPQLHSKLEFSQHYTRSYCKKVTGKQYKDSDIQRVTKVFVLLKCNQ